MVCGTYKSIVAMLAVVAFGSTDGLGVCYSPWHHSTVSAEAIKVDLQLTMTYFSSFRSFEALWSGMNAISIAASVGAKIAVGVQMNDLSRVDAEIQAVCDGYRENPSTVEVVWVGNENLQNNGFGTVSAEQLIAYIQQVKECTGGNVPVGTVQRINEWLTAEGADKVFAECGAAGVNIYPFFTPGELTPIKKFEAQWEQITNKYGSDKIQVTETGWPTGGEASFGNTPSLEIAQQYLNDFSLWAQVHVQSYWFMMFDSVTSYTGAEYEKSFGCVRSDGTPKLTIPAISGPSVGILTNTTESPEQQGHLETPVPNPADAPESTNNGPIFDAQVGVPLSRAPESPVQQSPEQQSPEQQSPEQQGNPADAPESPNDGPYWDGQVGVPLSRTPESPEQQSPEQQSPEQQGNPADAPESPNDGPYWDGQVGVPLSRTPESPVQQSPAVTELPNPADAPESPNDGPYWDGQVGVPLSRSPESGKDCAM